MDIDKKKRQIQFLIVMGDFNIKVGTKIFLRNININFELVRKTRSVCGICRKKMIVDMNTFFHKEQEGSGPGKT